MGFGSPPAPAVHMPPPAAHPPTLGSVNALTAQQTSKKKGEDAEGEGMDNTIKTTPRGLEAPQTATTTLLGG